MKLHELAPVEGARKRRKRIARGQGSGRGGTATKGHKGAQSRTSYKVKAHFEGGQMPIQRRMPKFGFKNPFRVEYKVVNLETLEILATEKGITEFDKNVYVENGLMSSEKYNVKVLGRGELTQKVKVTADAVSASAKAAIEKAGGEVVLIPRKELVIPHNPYNPEAAAQTAAPVEKTPVAEAQPKKEPVKAEKAEEAPETEAPQSDSEAAE